MTVKALEVLSEEERALVLETPALIAILISGADGEFDDSEESRARKTVNYKSVQGDNLLLDYYKAVDVTFVSALHQLEQKYAGSPVERAKAIVVELSKMNVILPKLDDRFARALIEDWKSLAETVAKASGGFLGYASISPEERHFIDLEMITYQP